MGAGLEVPRRRWVSGSVLFPARTRDANGASCYFNGARVCLAAGFPAAVGLASLFRDALLSRSSICSIPGCLVTVLQLPRCAFEFRYEARKGRVWRGEKAIGKLPLVVWASGVGGRGGLFLAWDCKKAFVFKVEL